MYARFHSLVTLVISVSIMTNYPQRTGSKLLNSIRRHNAVTALIPADSHIQHFVAFSHYTRWLIYVVRRSQLFSSRLAICRRPSGFGRAHNVCSWCKPWQYNKPSGVWTVMLRSSAPLQPVRTTAAAAAAASVTPVARFLSLIKTDRRNRA